MVCMVSVCAVLMSSCAGGSRELPDSLNAAAYAWHYRDIDSTETMARRALAASGGYGDGRAEALNHLVFVSLVRMDYDLARRQLDSVPLITDNQIEMLVAWVQQMRLCQRRSENREFYDCREKALQCLHRLNEDRASLTGRQRARLLYAETEMAIVTSTYYYYVGLEQQSAEAMRAVEHLVEQDTAQLMNYLYNVGAGGIITQGTQAEISQQEMDHLLRCLLLAEHTGSTFFVANALEAIADHLTDASQRRQLIDDNLPAMKYLNPDGVGEELLPQRLAEEALAIFRDYGDIYQTSGAYRTLASCYLAQADYASALDCLGMALSDSAINQAPDLVASIREQLSVAYAAIDDRVESSLNRNIYLDLQEETRQDRQREARAGQLEYSLRQTGRLLWAVVAVVAVMVLLIAFYHQRRRKRQHRPDAQMSERQEELREQTAMMALNVERAERRHLEQRAKVSLVMGILPLIDRILHAVSHPPTEEAGGQYVGELAEEIDRQNSLLTHWIQLRQGELSLRIETFPLQELMDMVGRSVRTFAMKGVTLQVQPTTAMVKGDRVLTLFMINTLADNARKFTPEGGTVTIAATEAPDYVEIAVSDTGCGMDEDQLAKLFTSHPSTPTTASSERLALPVSHGFGLLNCKGIIDKYRKTSSVFSVCQLTATSTPGKGSRLAFRLPKGGGERKRRALDIPLASLICLSSLMASSPLTASPARSSLSQAAIYADSAYFSNINGTFERTLLFADSCRRCLNAHYRQQLASGGDTLHAMGSLSTIPPEIRWLRDSIRTNYSIILDIRNESAVAALALHRWPLYQYNNRIYTQLFKELSADTTLDDYCRKMQQSQTNRQVAIIMLVLLFLAILAAVAWQLLHAMRLSASRRQQQQDRIDIMADELQRLTLENNALHVSNAVLDNTLSTLKHETMYYPSRIMQLVRERGAASLPLTGGPAPQEPGYEPIREVVGYYRELYALLSAQCMSQTMAVRLHLRHLDHDILGDENLVRYLFSLLRKENGQQTPLATFTRAGEDYVECRVAMPSLQRTDLFTPSTGDNIPWLLARQIVRDHGEATNRRGCAIRAEKAEGGVTIVITLPRAKGNDNQ